MILNYGNINKRGIFVKKLFFIILILSVVSGCKTTEGYRQVMETWTGHTEVELIRSRGTPSSTYTSGGIKFLEYLNSYTTSKSYYTSYSNSGSSSYSSPIGGNNFSCKTTYEVKNGIIENIKWIGNNCKSKETDEGKDIKPVNTQKINLKSYDDYTF